MTQKKGHATALREVAAMIRAAGIPGLRRPDQLEDSVLSHPGSFGGVVAEFSLSFYIGITLYVTMEADFDSKKPEESLLPKIRLSFSALNDPLEQITPAIMLHYKVMELAQMIRAYCSDYQFYAEKE